MANYEIDEITVTDGNIIVVNKNDVVLGISATSGKIVILRAIFSR